MFYPFLKMMWEEKKVSTENLRMYVPKYISEQEFEQITGEEYKTI